MIHIRRGCMLLLCLLMMLALVPLHMPVVSANGSATPPAGLTNSSFEEPVTGGQIPGWTSLLASGSGYGHEVTSARSYEGSSSLKITDGVTNGSVALLSSPIAVTPGDFYKGVAQLYIESGNTASLSLRYYDALGAQIQMDEIVTHNDVTKGFPSGAWTRAQTPETIAPAGAASARLMLSTTRYSVATAYYDSADIERRAAGLTNGSFDEGMQGNQIPGWSSMFATTGAQYYYELTDEIRYSEPYSLRIVDGLRDKSVALISDPIQVTPGDVYVGRGKLYMKSDSIASIDIRFYNQSGAQVNAGDSVIHYETAKGFPVEQWSDIVTYQATAPEEATTVRLVIFTTAYAIGEAAFDNLEIQHIVNPAPARLAEIEYGEYENLGAPIADTVGLFDGRTGMEDGHHVMYTTVKGIPPVFHVINLDDDTIIRSLPMEGAGDTWSHTVVPSGTVYVAAGSQLWAYSPVTKQIQNVFSYSGESTFWALDHDEQGRVYIATGPGSKIIQYDPATGTSRDYGRLSSASGQQYVRSIAYSNGYVYGGTSQSEVVRVDVETGQKTELAASLGETGYVYDLDIVDDRWLIVRYDTSKIRYVYDLDNEAWLNVQIENSASGLHLTKTSLNGKIYLPVGGQIRAFNLVTGQLETGGVAYGTGFRGADWIESDDPDLPGVSLVTMNFGGGYTYFNPQTNQIKTIGNFLPPAPSITHLFEKGANGKLYITGMQASKASEYDVFSGTHRLLPMGQAESVIADGDHVYFGIYPKAEFQRYTPASGNPPTALFSMGQMQDRPGASVRGGGKLFFGSIPDYGELGGALMVLDPSISPAAQSYQVYRNIVQDQSIISLAYKDGKIYGSTTINGGLTSVTAAQEAKLFVWDVATAEKEAEFSLNIPGLYKPPAIGGLSIGPDGMLWGGVNGIVFAIDPSSLALVKYKKLTSDGPWGQWGSYKAVWSDGILYMHLGRRLVAIDPITLDHVLLADSETFAIGADGHLYFSPHAGVAPGSNRTLMYRIQVKDKTHPGTLHVSAPLLVEQGEEFEVAVHVSQTVNLNGVQAELVYDTSAFQYVSAEATGSFATATASLQLNAHASGLTITGQLGGVAALDEDEQIVIVRFKALQTAEREQITLTAQSTARKANDPTAYQMKQDHSITIQIAAATE